MYDQQQIRITTNTKYPNDPAQARWLTMAKNGDKPAFNHIGEEYRQPIYNFCYRMLKNEDEAEDAAQEVLMRVYSKLDSYDETRTKFTSWLFAIANYYCIDQLRLRRHQLVSWDDLPTLSHLFAGETFQPEKVLLKKETNQEVHSLLNVLPPDYRDTIILKYWHYRSCQEIAQTLNTTVSAIKSKLFRARQKMAQAAI